MQFIRNGFFGILFIFLLFSLYKNFSGFRKNIEFYESYKTQLDKAKKENTRLKTAKLQTTSLREIEKTIRNKLNLLKPNEIAVIVPPPSPTPTPAITPAIPVYRQWWNTFFKVD